MKLIHIEGLNKQTVDSKYERQYSIPRNPQRGSAHINACFPAQMFKPWRLIFHLLFIPVCTASPNARPIPSHCQKSVNYVYLSTLSAIGLSERKLRCSRRTAQQLDGVQGSRRGHKGTKQAKKKEEEKHLINTILFQCQELQGGEGSKTFLLTLLVFNGQKCFH